MMRTKTLLSALAVGTGLAALSAISFSAFAQNSMPATVESTQNRLSIPQIRDKVQAAGYRDSDGIERKHEGYEPKATDRHGHRVELVVDMRTGDVTKTEVKRNDRTAATHKWPTDPALEEGMTNIRRIVEPYLPLIRAGRFADGHYDTVGNAVERQLTYIVGNCKLEPEADAILHGLIARLQEGVDQVRGPAADGTRSEGITRIVSALNDYGQSFDHAGWKPVDQAKGS